jgi:hypothetical protein
MVTATSNPSVTLCIISIRSLDSSMQCGGPYSVFDIDGPGPQANPPPRHDTGSRFDTILNKISGTATCGTVMQGKQGKAHPTSGRIIKHTVDPEWKDRKHGLQN